MALDLPTALLTIAAFVGGQIVIAAIQEFRATRDANRQRAVRAEERAADEARAVADRRRALGQLEIEEARRALLTPLEYHAMRAAGSTQTDRLEEARLSMPRTSELVRWDADTVGDAGLVLDVLDAIDKFGEVAPTTDPERAASILREHATLRRRVVQALREQERRLAEGLPLERHAATLEDLNRVNAMRDRPIRLAPEQGLDAEDQGTPDTPPL